MSKYLAVQCQTCMEVRISRANHDFNHCSCVEGGCYIDGDSRIRDDGAIGYYRVGGDYDNIKTFHVELPFSHLAIYSDYNTSKNKWQTIDTDLYPLIEIEHEVIEHGAEVKKTLFPSTPEGYVKFEDMDINSPVGSILVYTSNGGYDLERAEANKFLTVGKAYTMSSATIHNWKTDIMLEEFPNKIFNSVMFINALV